MEMKNASPRQQTGEWFTMRRAERSFNKPKNVKQKQKKYPWKC